MNESSPPRQIGQIQSIDVTDLFGRHTYNLTPPEDDDPARNGLMLMYGGNGTGKTTILRLVWNLLSPLSNRGHRSYLARTPFRTLQVSFSGGYRILVSKLDELVGSFELIVRDNRKRRVLVHIGYRASSPDYSVRDSTTYDILELNNKRRKETIHPSDESYTKFLRSSGRLPIFLSDDRQLHSDFSVPGPEKRVQRFGLSLDEFVAEGADKKLSIVSLESSIRGATDALRRLALGGQRIGTASSQNVYLDVFKQLAKRPADDAYDAFDDLIRRIEDIGQKTDKFAEFELAPKFDSAVLIAALKRIPLVRRDVAIHVAGPFIESLDSRLEALTQAEFVTREFVNLINEFLFDKRVSYRVSEGIVVRMIDTNEQLEPAVLSSGERQLLLLLCNTLIARESASLFLIDEPELSLNARWQRVVIQSLLRLTQGTQVQFIVASHSVEMVSKNRTSLVRLEGH